MPGTADRSERRAGPSPGAHGAGPVVPGPIERLTRALALAGGGFLLVAVVITLASVIGRYGFGRPVPGDYELVEIICAVGIFLFFPYTHSSDSNISARFFTSGLSEGKQRALDVVHDIVFTGIAGILTWRLSVGLIDKFSTGEATILIRIPFWWAYSFAVLSMALLTLVCLARIASAIGAVRR
jgi:TRAP-type C4-dicarboxylate transport system permease small subunit